MPLKLRGLLAGVAVLAAACTDPGKPELCFNDERPSIPDIPDTTLKWARVTIKSVTSFDANGVKTVQNSITADLVDNTDAYNVQRAQTTLGISGPGCYGLTGKTITKCQPGKPEPCTVDKLEADKIEVLGLPGGTVTLDRTAQGAYSKDGLPDPLFGKGPLTARITSRNETGLFPSMELQVTQPDRLVVTAPVLDPTGKPLPAGDIKVRWNAGNGALVALLTTRFPLVEGDDLQCVTPDDGCTTLVQSDLDQFDHTVGRQFKLQIIRDITDVKPVGNVALEVKAVSEVDMVLAR